MILHKHTQLLKFCIVGGFGTFVTLGTLYFFTDICQIYYLYSNILSISISILSNFILNDLWTFKNNKDKPVQKRLPSFILISISGMIINTIVLYILTDIIHLYYLLSSFVGVLIVFPWNFLWNKYVTWKK